MSDHEVLLVIEAHQKRLETWDALLVNHAANVAAPPTKGSGKHKKLDVEKMHLFKRPAPTAQPLEQPRDELAERRRRQERFRERVKELGMPASMRRRFGDNVTIKRPD